MRFLLAVTGVLISTPYGNTEEVCFDGFEELGCFSMDSPWKTVTRPLPRPKSPSDVGTRFYMFTRGNVTEPFNVTLWPSVDLEGSNFDASRRVVFITHGFASSGSAKWVNDLKDALLENMDANVFINDWGSGASKSFYFQVASNTRVVGAEMARLLKYLTSNYSVQPEQIHLIGHSLGAHISSYAAKEIPGIYKLTEQIGKPTSPPTCRSLFEKYVFVLALDPAQPFFELFSSTVRLDKEDAKLVEVIHTDAKPIVPLFGFGMIGSHGHVDYYLNGGISQPGCFVPKNTLQLTNILDLGNFLVEDIQYIVQCPHGRSHAYYTASLKNPACVFWGHRKTVLKSIISGAFIGRLDKFLIPREDCDIESCIPLGMNAENYPARGDFVVPTSSVQPYCISEPEVDRTMARQLKSLRNNK